MRVQAGLRSFGGYVLGDAVERMLVVPEFPRELSILGQGSLLSLSGEKTLSLFARNVPAMRIEVGRLLPRQLQHLVSQTGGSFDVPQFNNRDFDAANITERFVRIAPLPKVAPGKPQYDALDLGEYLDTARRRPPWHLHAAHPGMGPGARPSPRAQRRTLERRSRRPGRARMVVVTDLGLVVKRAVDGAQDVFVQSIADGTPVAGATVDIIGRNGLPVLSETTDAEGHVRFPELRSFQHEHEPVLYLARRGEDSSFIPVSGQWDTRGRGLDLSRFDIGGVDSAADRGALSAYLFSDRGIYRPGEEIRAAAIVRSQDWNRDVSMACRCGSRSPIRAAPSSVARPSCRAAPASARSASRPARHRPPAHTRFASPWCATSTRSDLIGSTTVQVRDFQPDRLRMSARFSAHVGGWLGCAGGALGAGDISRTCLAHLQRTAASPRR